MLSSLPTTFPFSPHSHHLCQLFLQGGISSLETIVISFWVRGPGVLELLELEARLFQAGDIATRSLLLSKLTNRLKLPFHIKFLLSQILFLNSDWWLLVESCYRNVLKPLRTKERPQKELFIHHLILFALRIKEGLRNIDLLLTNVANRKVGSICDLLFLLLSIAKRYLLDHGGLLLLFRLKRQSFYSFGLILGLPGDPRPRLML